MSSAASRLMPTLRRVVLAGTVADRTDGQLLGAFVADRDADAFAGLVRRHGPMVLGVCRRITGDHTVAEDAFQAVFIVLARRAAAVKPREQVGNWLYGVAYRTALKARMVLARRRSREKQVDVMPEPPLAGSDQPDWVDLQPIIDEELARLPDKFRLPVVLCDLEGRTQRDVAKQLGVPPATLATRLASARRTLASRLTRRGVTLSGGALAGLLSAHATASGVPHSLVLGMSRAAEAVAGGNMLSTLVSANAVQLSEGVMRMMLLSKLKTVSVTVLTAVALSGGLGLGLLPAYAHATGDDSTPGYTAAAAKPAAAEKPATDDRFNEIRVEGSDDVDDATFLRRLSLDMRGLLPTDVETFFFIADEDKEKRAKVVVWMVDDGEAREVLAKRLGVPAASVRVVQVVGGEGEEKRLIVLVDTDEKLKPHAVKPHSVAFSPDGKTIAIEVVGNSKTNTLRVLPTIVEGKSHDVKKTVTVDAKGLRWAALTGKSGELPQGFFHLFQHGTIPDGKGRAMLWSTASDDGKAVLELEGWYFSSDGRTGDTDLEFLKRVIKDVRGAAPTALEEKYFAEDKDSKKREKLIDMLLKDPAVAKKLGADWKKKMLAPEKPGAGGHPHLFKMHGGQRLVVPVELKSGEYKLVAPGDPKSGGVWTFETPKVAQPPVPPVPPKPPVPQVEKFDRVVGELLAAKKSDSEMLEAVTLVVLGRLPTEIEKKLTLGLVSKAADRKAAWLEVARALAASGSKPADVIKLKSVIEGKEGALEFKLTPRVDPVPPVKKK